MSIMHDLLRPKRKDKRKDKFKKQPYKDKDSVRADEFIKHCTSCKRCWEYDRRNKQGSLHVYDNFPTYGKQKETCPICLSK